MTKIAIYCISLCLALALSSVARSDCVRTDLGSPWATVVGCNALGPNNTGEYNTATGFQTLTGNTSGTWNTATGLNALYFNTTGWYNTATGGQALFSNTTGSNNTATGVNALYSNTTGINNTATGYAALFSNTTGQNNTAMGLNALILNTTGSFNTAVGDGTLYRNTTASYNVALGYMALISNTTGDKNTGVGSRALQSNTGPTPSLPQGGTSNTAVGYDALNANTTGWQNTAVGESVLRSNITGSHNSGFGEDALFRNKSGIENTGIGESALYDNVAGNFNVALGYFTLNHGTGSRNVALGMQAGCNLISGDNNIYIGSLGTNNESNVIRIGGSAALSSSKCPESVTLPTQSATYIAGITGVPVTGAAVYVNGNGQLGVLSSSARFKKDVQSLGSASEKVLNLRPVSFRYKQADESGAYPLQYGLIAEEVAKVFPNLVQYDKDGRPFAVHYNLLTPLLVAEVQQQHAANRQLLDEVTTLRTQTAAQADQLAAIGKRLDSLQRQLRSDRN